jgi:8-oxo-dGTP pyrophosphatase MutT (NUDIX family)
VKDRRYRREISAGCVIYRRSDRGTEVALTKPAGRDAWALPKGLIETGEAPEQAAHREATEETGLTGEIVDKIDTIKYVYTAAWEAPPARVFKIVTFYLMQCTGGDTDRHDQETEEVAWLPIAEAIARASYGTEKEILRKAESLIKAGATGGGERQ